MAGRDACRRTVPGPSALLSREVAALCRYAVSPAVVLDTDGPCRGSPSPSGGSQRAGKRLPEHVVTAAEPSRPAAATETAVPQAAVRARA